MTPSEAHDSARNRDAGHDEMQAAVWRYLSTSEADVMLVKVRDGEERFIRSSVWIEEPFTIRGRIVCWADVGATYVPEDASARSRGRRLLHIMEIKPKIWSVGAVLRQCRSLDYLVRAGQDSSVLMRVTPVVDADDPKLHLLKEVYPDVMAWRDGAPA